MHTFSHMNRQKSLTTESRHWPDEAFHLVVQDYWISLSLIPSVKGELVVTVWYILLLK